MVTTRAEKRRAVQQSDKTAPAKRPRKPAAGAASRSTTAISSSKLRRTRLDSCIAPKHQSRISITHLPYHILLDIFINVSAGKDQCHGWSDSPLLLMLATRCKAFYEPAITALYRNPPTDPPHRSHQLLATLKNRPELGQKIKYLAFEVEPLLRLTTPGYGYFDLAGFVRRCRGLRELALVHGMDRAPYRADPPPPAWRYPEALFDALEGAPEETVVKEGDGDENCDVNMEEGVPIRLQSWHWNFIWLFNGKTTLEEGLQKITSIHLQQSFQSLKRLSISWMSLSDMEKEFLRPIALLPNLEELELIACLLDTEAFEMVPEYLPNLRLKSLSFTSCTVFSEVLALVLSSPLCHELESLAINHCAHTSLAFLPALSNTPRLRSLSFDGNYFRTSNFYNDAKPGYDTLLPVTAIPVWPPALTSLTLVYLRRWSGTEAEALLDSLLAAAPNLPSMRHLTLHCILDDDGLGWRERARLRDKYVDLLLQAFVRPSSEPSPTPTPYVSDEDGEGKLRRSTRKRTSSGSTSPKKPVEKFKGFCERDRVEIKMDNARPTEMHFDEDDFVDSTPVISRAVRGRVRSGGGRARVRGGGGAGGGGGGRTAPPVQANEDDDESDDDYVD